MCNGRGRTCKNKLKHQLSKVIYEHIQKMYKTNSTFNDKTKYTDIMLNLKTKQQ